MPKKTDAELDDLQNDILGALSRVMHAIARQNIYVTTLHVEIVGRDDPQQVEVTVYGAHQKKGAMGNVPGKTAESRQNGPDEPIPIRPDVVLEERPAKPEGPAE